MKVYVDTGVFIDYLSKQALNGASLRGAPRNGRPPAQLFDDARTLFDKLAASHIAASSCLTLYEVEEALHKVWEAEAKGVVNAGSLRVAAARSIMPQAAMAMEVFKFTQLSLTPHIVADQLRQPVLVVAGVRAADALHVMTASAFGAELIVSADKDVLQLDQKMLNSAGQPMRCLDTDQALLLL